MGFLATKLHIVGFALAALLGFACVNLFLENSKLQSINSVLLKDLESAKENERIKKIYVKDKSCEAELAAYKEMFRD